VVLRRHWPCLLALALLALLLAERCPAQSAPDRAEIKTLLTKFRHTNIIEQADIDRLKRFEKTTLPLLAEVLPDSDLGHFAEVVMQQIDSIGATPYLLKVLPQADGSRQHEVFAAANRSMEQYEWHVRAGAPKPDPAKPPPRYPRNTEPYPFARQLHDAAVACLQGGLTTQKGAERDALLTVGTTGNRRDIPLLKQYAAKAGNSPVVEGSFHQRAVAAQTRLGDREAFDEIVRDLNAPVKTKPAEPYSRGVSNVWIQPKPGEIVVEPSEAQRLRMTMFQAAYAMDRRFVPFLIRHLDDAPGQFHGDSADPSPAREAEAALGRIVFGQESPYPPTDWKRWWQEHAKEYGSH